MPGRYFPEERSVGLLFEVYRGEVRGPGFQARACNAVAFSFFTMAWNAMKREDLFAVED